jgi:hypothetical protein
MSLREIEVGLVSHGLVAATENRDVIMLDCPVDCLRSVLSGRVLNRLARADGCGVPVAPCGPSTTVGDVVRLYREGRLGEIAGLGPKGITEIEAGLVFAGLILADDDPAQRQPDARPKVTSAPSFRASV